MNLKLKHSHDKDGVTVSGKFKQPIIDRLGQFFEEQGFKEDKSSLMSNNFGFVFSKGDQNHLLEPNQVSIEQNIPLSISREEIVIHRNRWMPEFTVMLRSFQNESSATNLWMLAGYDVQKWWRFDDKEKLDQACNEIIDLMNEYGWKWLELP